MTDLPWTQPTATGVSFRIDLSVYPLEVVLRACHAFTGRCYLFVRDVADGAVAVDLAPRDERDSLRDLAGELSNALIDWQLRATIAAETRPIRELLVAQAFCEADLLDRQASESDEYADPRGIAR